MPSYGKMFGPTASAAGVLTAIAPTTGWLVPPGQFTVKKLIVSSSNVVEDLANSGFVHIDVSGPEGGRYAVAYGGGKGNATNGGPSITPAEQINVSIPIKGGQTVIVSMLDSNTKVDARVCLIYWPGSGPKMMSLCGYGAATVAGTELTLAAVAALTGINLTPTRNGFIREIRWAGAGIIDALAQGNRLKLEIPGEPDMYEFCVGTGSGGAALGGPQDADCIQGLEIPVRENQPVVVKLLGKATTGAALLTNCVSLTVL